LVYIAMEVRFCLIDIFMKKVTICLVIIKKSVHLQPKILER